jgi:beta-lactamase regulating signal transducer with metallopeptidase domain
MTWTDALGWSLLHFLWEGAIIAVLAAGVLAVLRRSGAHIRYAVNCAALILMLIAFVATLQEMRTVPASSRSASDAAAATPAAPDPASWGGPALAPVRDYMPALVWAWFGGVIALTIRSIGGWAAAGRFARRHTWAADASWEERFGVLVDRLRIARPVRLAVSAVAQVPAVVGWMKPVVLVPAGIFAHLTGEQIEALIAHELAHVCRHDYLVNLLQTAAETLFFYHPAVWWVSRNIRNEREHCCDDLAVKVCGDTVAYVRALTELEQMRGTAPPFAMAANGGSLVSRVQHLLRANDSAGRAPAGWIAAIGVAACMFAAGIARNGMAQRHDFAPIKPTDVVAQADAIAGAPEPPVAPTSTRQRRAPQPVLVAEAAPPEPPQPQEQKKPSGSWLEEMQAAGYKDLDVDRLISLKIHGVTGDYIRGMRGAGYNLNADDLIAFRIHGVSIEFMNGLKQVGWSNLKPDQLIALRIHGVTADSVRQMQGLGYPNLSVDEAIGFRINGVTPEFIREAQRHGFKNLKPDQLVRLRQMDILKAPEII